MLTEGEDFEFVERPGSELYSVRLLTTDWQGVIFTYGKVSFREDKKKDELKVSFSLRIEDPGQNHSVADLEDSGAFQRLTGDLLTVILNAEKFSIGKQPSQNKQD